MPVAAPHPSLLVSLGVIALILWRLYARIRRMVGRQKLSRRRPWFTVALFPLLLLLLATGSLAHPLALAALVGGVALGTGLGRYGLRLTRFETTPLGLFYTPSAHLGIALSLLFVGRLAYRFVQVGSVFGGMAGAAQPGGSADFARSPLTLIILATLAGYYVTYAIGLLRWAGRAAAETAAGDPAAPEA